MVHQVLDKDGEIKQLDDLTTLVRPMLMEYLKTFCMADFKRLLLAIRPKIGIFNVYGRIMFRKKKGCLYFYKLLTACKK